MRYIINVLTETVGYMAKEQLNNMVCIAHSMNFFLLNSLCFFLKTAILDSKVISNFPLLLSHDSHFLRATQDSDVAGKRVLQE